MNDASGTTENERLQGLLEAWFESLEAGEEPTVDVICKDAPELAPMLLRIVEQESDVTDALSVLAPSRGEERQLSAEVLGDFRIMSFLGAGGMGQVHLARQESLGGRLVALKVLHSTISSTSTRQTGGKPRSRRPLTTPISSPFTPSARTRVTPTWR